MKERNLTGEPLPEKNQQKRQLKGRSRGRLPKVSILVLEEWRYHDGEVKWKSFWSGVMGTASQSLQSPRDIPAWCI